MPFDEAVELARLIRQAPGWYVLEVGAASGEKLDADLWAVQAVNMLNWSRFHYWKRPSALAEWPAYRASWERAEHGGRNRESTTPA